LRGVSETIWRAAQLALLLMTAGSPIAAEEKIFTITPKVKAILDDYLNEPYPMAFADSPDGGDADYVFCSRPGCNANQPIHQRDAINHFGSDCVILAVGKEIKLKYQVAELPPAVIADLPLCEPGSLAADFPDGMAEAHMRADTCSGFRKFMSERHFKAFAVTDMSASDAIGAGRPGTGQSMRPLMPPSTIAETAWRTTKPRANAASTP
jgi:hypothetical protein